MKTFWKFYRRLSAPSILSLALVGTLLYQIQDGVSVSAAVLPQNEINKKPEEYSPNSGEPSISSFPVIGQEKDPENNPLPFTDNESKIQKRHIASLGRSVYRPYQSQYGKRYFSAPLISNYRFNLRDRMETNGNKRFLASLLDSGSVPRGIGSVPGKRHIGSLVKSPSNKRYFASLLKQTYPQNYLAFNKKFSGFTQESFDPSDGEGDMNATGLLGEEIELGPSGYDAIDGSEEIALSPFDEALLSNHLKEADKRHLSSLFSKREPSEFSEVGNDDGGLVSKRHFSSLLDDSKIGTEYLRSFLGRDNHDKRHFSSLLDKRYLGSILDNDGFNKRYLASLLDSQSSPQKRYFASLLDDNNISDVKRYITSLLEQNERGYGNTGERLDTFENNYFTSNPEDVDDNVPIREKRELPTQFENAALPKIGEEGIEGEDEKRHFSSLLNKRYLAALIKNRLSNPSTNKRHLASIFDKRYLSSLYDKRYLSSLYDKRHLASLYDKRHLASLYDKRHLASLYDKRYLASLYDKRFLASLLDKRYLASLLDKKDAEPNYLPQLDEGMTNVDSIADIKQESQTTTTEEDKRHFSSLLKSGVSDSKRVPEETFNDEIFETGTEAEKRHVGSLRGYMYGKRRFFSTLLRDEIEEEKRHFSSLLDKRDDTEKELKDSNTKTDENEDGNKNGSPNSDGAHPRKKRYIGALAKNNNLPFRHSRGFGSARSINRGVNLFEYIDNYIREALKKEEVRRRIREDGLKFSSRYTSSDEDPNKIIIAEQTPSYEGPGDEKAYVVPEEVGYFGTPKKRFLGSLARQMWFPRQYRSSFSDTPTNSGHFGVPVSASLRRSPDDNVDKPEDTELPEAVAYIPVVYQDSRSFYPAGQGNPRILRMSY